MVGDMSGTNTLPPPRSTSSKANSRVDKKSPGGIKVCQLQHIYSDNQEQSRMKFI